jgi:hypothetical protein
VNGEIGRAHELAALAALWLAMFFVALRPLPPREMFPGEFFFRSDALRSAEEQKFLTRASR